MAPLGLHRTRRTMIAIGVSLTLLVGLAPAAQADPPAPGELESVPAEAPGRYIVTLKSAPVATYDGSVSGLPATAPEDGREVSTTSDATRRYRAYLDREQSAVAAEAGVTTGRRFSISLNGFTSRLTTTEVLALRSNPDVLSVAKDAFWTTDDDRNSVDYLRLSGSRGLWSKLGGTDRAGAGVVVGVIDSGIWPESASFSGEALRRRPPGDDDPHRPYVSRGKIIVEKSDGSTFSGSCSNGVDWTIKNCNTKLVGARFFGDTFLDLNPGTEKTDFISPRDGESHGTHTAATAAGNAGVAAEVDGRSYGRVSGVAPAAKIASYKALWTGPNASGGYSSDLVAAIDAAVADGVDVINYSVGSTTEAAHDGPVALAFLSAASAGIFVAASAGNSGPTASSLDNTAPWVMTVAASTIAPYEATVRLGNGTTYLGVSTTVGSGVPSSPLVTGAEAKTAAATAAAATACSPASLDPARTAGKIVVCERGVVDRVLKSAEVKRAGGVGVVLINPTTNSLDADSHALPTVILNPPASAAVTAYAAAAGATAALVPGNQTGGTIPYPQIAGSSSRGPSIQSNGDLLKPDVAAPGVAILAAVAPPSNGGRSFDFLSGTSMSAPHVAGLAALYFGERPRWSPMQVKSALMTTARDVKTATGGTETDPFAQGAGEIEPRDAFDPGLVYRSRDRDWLAYLEGLGVGTGTGVRAKDPSDYNAPSIAIGSLLGSQTVTRRVTALRPGTYRAQVSVPGFDVRVSPSTLRFDRRQQTKSFTVTLTRRTAPVGRAATGFLTWRGNEIAVRSPIAVTPRTVEAPTTVAGAGPAGALGYTITPGVSGAFPIRAYGLAPVEVTAASLAKGGSRQFSSTVPAGAKAAQFSLRTTASGADLDLSVYQVVGTTAVLVGTSATPAANETVTLRAPTAGRYIALVRAPNVAPGATTVDFVHRAGSVGATSREGAFTVDPTDPTVRAGRSLRVTASWSGLDAAKPYVGWVAHADGDGTLVAIN